MITLVRLCASPVACVGLLIVAGATACASVPTPETALQARLDAAAAACAARDTAGGRDTTAVYGAGFEAPGFKGAAPDPRSRFHMKRPGQVEVEFVVDTAGHADLCISRVLQETEPGLGNQLLDAVSHWSFTPAEYQGHKVRQAIRVVENAVAVQ